MENTFSVKMIFHFYHSVVKAELKRRGFPKEVAKKIEEEHGKIVARAKDCLLYTSPSPRDCS